MVFVLSAECFSAALSHPMIWCGSAVAKGVETWKTSSISMWSSFHSRESAFVRIPWRAECVCDQKLCDARRDRWKMCFLSRWILIRFFPENRPLVMFYSSFNALMRFSKLPRHEKACLGNLPLARSCLLYCHILNRPKTWVLRTELNHSLVKLPLLPAWKLSKKKETENILFLAQTEVRQTNPPGSHKQNYTRSFKICFQTFSFVQEDTISCKWKKNWLI